MASPRAKFRSPPRAPNLSGDKKSSRSLRRCTRVHPIGGDAYPVQLIRVAVNVAVRTWWHLPNSRDY